MLKLSAPFGWTIDFSLNAISFKMCLYKLKTRGYPKESKIKHFLNHENNVLKFSFNHLFSESF